MRRRHEVGPLMEDERLGGHARRVMAAYERMFGGDSAEVGILRMLGLLDRPADEGEIAALRAQPVVPGLTDAVVGISGKVWNTSVARLRRVGLLSRAEGERDWRLDAHPLVREHFVEQVRREREEPWREGHRRLYEHLKEKAKHGSQRRWRKCSRSIRRLCTGAGRGRTRRRSISGGNAIGGTASASRGSVPSAPRSRPSLPSSILHGSASHRGSPRRTKRARPG